MSQVDINIAMQQAKILYVRQTQYYLLGVATLHVMLVFVWGWAYAKPEIAIVYVTLELLLLSFVVLRLGARVTVNFGLLSALLMILVLPFGFIVLIPLKQFQQDREYIDYKRRAALLPSLKASSVHNFVARGQLPMSAWLGVSVGPLLMVLSTFKFEQPMTNTILLVFGLAIFTVGLWTFNRTNIAIRGEKIIIRRSGLGGNFRRSNFSVIHRIEITQVAQRGGRLRIKYAFVGTGIEREVIFFGSTADCKQIADTLTTHGEDTLYDIRSLERESEEPGAIEEEQGPSEPRTSSHIGVRTLISAIRSNHMGLVKQLIEVGVDVNARDLNGQTPMQIAEHSRNEQIIHMLRRAGAKA